jgi:hypothetical protein
MSAPRRPNSPQSHRGAPRDQASRRRWLQAVAQWSAAGVAAGLPVAGFSSARAAARASDSGAPDAGAGRAKHCIFLFLDGGPSHIDTWDLKPAAPVEFRGEFRPIASSVPGLVVCEHLPRVAEQMHRFALVRSVHHKIVDHNAGAYYCLTGRPPTVSGRLILKDEPTNFPPYGSVLAKLRPGAPEIPAFVQTPDWMFNNGFDLPGQRAGFLAPAGDPLLAGDPSVPDYEVPGLALSRDVTAERIRTRAALREAINGAGAGLKQAAAVGELEARYEQAYELLASPRARAAFRVQVEPREVRERYGLPDRTDRSVEARKFGGLPHLGQTLLLARRLIESGVRTVTIGAGRRIDQAWDTHRQHFPLLKRSLLPYLDQALAALVSDLAERGLLDETLVVVAGEFGRTPRVGQITSSAGADAGGRDHWPHCYCALFAGGGTQGGAVYGASDRTAAYPARDPVTPEDLAATIYHAFGLDPDERIHDPADRPHSIALGTPIRALFGL